MTEPRTVKVNLRASPRFKEWFQKEAKRKGITQRELCELLALTYASLNHVGKQKGVTPWPQS